MKQIKVELGERSYDIIFNSIESDAVIADLMTDGCDMGIKSLTKQLNKYKNASDEARSVAEEVIAAEEKLECQLRDYL